MKPMKSANGPLRLHPKNPRYFTTDDMNALYLVGSHTWANFQDLGLAGDAPFDFEGYVAELVERKSNFVRLWSWEHTAWATWCTEKVLFTPTLYRRIGSEQALDGAPQFDLSQIDQSYLDRLRARLIHLEEAGVYAAVMLFQGFSSEWIWHYGDPYTNLGNPFRGHPYHPENNIQGFDGGTDNGVRVDLSSPRVREFQAAYIKAVVETVNDFDHIIFEVINEGGNEEWHEFVMATVRECEQHLPKKHLVGMTGHGSMTLDKMLASTADWIAPGFHDSKPYDLILDPPASITKIKPSILDTDHLWGTGMDYKWVWRSFLRGYHVLFMDPAWPLRGWFEPEKNTRHYPGYEEGRKAMTQTMHLANRVDLANLEPRPELASTGFCLAELGRTYIVYFPNGGAATLDLSAVTGTLQVEWIDPIQGTIVSGAPLVGSKTRTLFPPFANDAVLFMTI
jgi:hypothetical protein